MKSSSVRYGLRAGCRFGVPHQYEIVKDTPSAKYERCVICQDRKRWNKGFKNRVDNNEYLKAHVREYAQPHGSTKRIFMKLHKPEKCIIKIN